MQTAHQVSDDLHIAVALRHRQLHRIPVGRDEQRERLHRARQDRAVIQNIRAAALRHGEAADVRDEEAVLEDEIHRNLARGLHLLRERHIRLMQRVAAVGSRLGAVEQLFALHLTGKEGLCAAEHLLERQAAVFRQVRQVDEADKVARRDARQQRTKVDRDLRDDRLVPAAELAVERAHHERRDDRERADADALCTGMQLRKRERDLADDLARGRLPLHRRRVNGLRLFPDALRGKLAVGKLFVTVRALLRRPSGVHRADRAVVLDRAAAVLQILEQDAADEFLEAASVRDRMLIFLVIADEEQIAVRVGRADSVARGNAVERQHDRRAHIRAVAEAGLGALDAQHHVRKAQQRLLDRLAQLVRAHPVLHADGVARHARHGLVRVVKENLRVTVRAQARIVHHIHS